jgi:hypothetical protein
MLTLYISKEDVMHVLPLPFGLGLALRRRQEACHLRRRKAVWSTEPLPPREYIRTESRFAEFRQRFV